MEKTFKLVAIDTQLPKEKQKEKIIFEGSEIECLRKFQSVCSFSFSNHKEYSWINYEIKQ